MDGLIGRCSHLDALAVACSSLDAARQHGCSLAEMMVNRQGHQLERWLNEVTATGLPELRSFVTGLRRDFDASPPASPCTTAQDQSKAMSTASK